MTSPSNQWFMFDLFQRLRQELDLGLEMRQYWLFLESYNYHGIQAKQELLFLCKTLWLSKAKYELEFNRLFEISYNGLLQQKESSVKPDSNPNGTKYQDILNNEEQDLGNSDTNGNTGNSVAESTGSNNEDETSGSTPKNDPVVQTEKREIIININDSEGFSASSHKDIDIPFVSFILSDFKYLPFDTRAMEQGLRKVRGRSKHQLTRILDIHQMVKQKGELGLIYELLYQSKFIGSQKIVWFSDYGGSMTPFSYWDDQLFEIMQNVPNTDRVERYFFHDYPPVKKETDKKNETDYIFFQNRSFAQTTSLSKILKDANKNTIIIFFSDGGGARKHEDEERIDTFYEIVEKIRLKTPSVGWINPVKNIDKSPAKYISFFIKTVYASNNGIRKLLQHMQNQ